MVRDDIDPQRFGLVSARQYVAWQWRHGWRAMGSFDDLNAARRFEFAQVVLKQGEGPPAWKPGEEKQ